MAAQAWSISVTSHHLQVDWALWSRARRVRVFRHDHAATLGVSMYAPGGVVNDVYGFKPHAPSAFFQSIKWIELAAVLAMSGVACLPNSAAVYSTLGGGRVASVDALCVVAPVLTAIGITLLVGGALIAYATRVGFW